MNGDGSVVLRSARGSRAGEGDPPSRTFLRTGAFLLLDSSRSSFRRAAAATDAKQRPGFQTSTRAACAPQIAAEPPVDI
jgi:hypothetical protein